MTELEEFLADIVELAINNESRGRDGGKLAVASAGLTIFQPGLPSSLS